MDVVTIDFETYYDDDYSLSKLTTEQYIRSPLFEVIGVGIKVNDHPADWYSGSNPGRFLKSLNYRNRAILCHNTAFDGAILSWKFGIQPRLWLDTLSMARPLHNLIVGGSLKALAEYYGIGQKGDEVIAAKGRRLSDFTQEQLHAYGQYCVNDVDMTYKLFQILKRKIPVSELMVIDQTIRMYTDPVVELHEDILREHLAAVRTRKQMLLNTIAADRERGEHTVEEMLMSNDKFAAYLQHLNVDPPRKVSARTGKETWAFAKTDKGLLALLEHPDERVQAAVSARLGTKSTIEETRTENLIGVAQRGRLPIMLNYYGAHTGRFSGGDKLNLQNLPKRGNVSIRRALRAPEGHVFVACDSSQIEARMIAWLAGQEDLVEAFRLGRDIYSEFATDVYGRPITKADKIERFVGKTCILGLGYGMGGTKFQRTLEIGQGDVSVKIDMDEAIKIVMMYRNKYWKIVQFWKRCDNALRGMLENGTGSLHPSILPYDPDGIILPNGLRIQYPLLRAATQGYAYCGNSRDFKKIAKQRVVGGEPVDMEWTKIYGGKVAENLVQALAALVIREQMVAIGQRWKVAFQVHDEIIIVAPAAQADDAEKDLVSVMSTPPKWAPDLPVACESGIAENYGDV
jgi:DNA polymerase